MQRAVCLYLKEMLGNRIVADYELVNIFSSKTCRISKIGQK
jgi:hypothetical protein